MQQSVQPASEGPVVFYVSPEGRDRWSGRLADPAGGDGPFATVQRAQCAVRALKRQGQDRPVRVVLRGGIYFLDRPLAFTSKDGGSREHPVEYCAAEGETPVLSGGARIEGFQPARVNGRPAWVAPVPEARKGWRFRQLFVDGRRRTRTRLPKRGLYRIERVLDLRHGKHPWQCPMRRFGYAAGDIRRWSRLRDIEVVALTRWIENRLPVRAVDARRRIVTFDRPSRHGLQEDRDASGTQYWVENVFEALDTPGQWYLDRAEGRLCYLPKRGERIGQVQVVAPRLAQVLHLEGSAGRPVEHLTFRGVAFAHAEWDPPPGWAGSAQAAWEVPGAVVLRHARNCRFERCAVERVGGYGVEIGEGCMDVVIDRCRIADLGAGGVKAWHGSRRTTITDCEIAHGGRLFPSAVGVLIGDSPGNQVLHNHIHDFFYTGISVGWVWGYGPSEAAGNVVEWNHVHDLGQGLLSDLGGVYTLGVSPGTRIRFNLFYDIRCRRYGGWGIYTDEGSSDILIEKNVAHRCNVAPFHQHYGRDNLIVNNILAFGGENQVERTRIEDHLSFVFRGNIVCYDRGQAVGRNWNRPQAVFERNLYFNASGGPVTFAGRSFEEWQALGLDAGSRIADPLFRDPHRSDFALLPGSPAPAMGFEPFDLSAVGPRQRSDMTGGHA